MQPGSKPASVGSEYPDGWERTARTRDGMDYLIRPIRLDDLDRDRAFIMNLSSTSRYNRMMGALREPSAELLDRFVHVDYRNTMAFVAVTGVPSDERFIAVARYAADDARQCEFAIAVADDWQSRGIGKTLMRLLFEYARAQGLRRIYGRVLASNQPMRSLAHSLQMDLRRSRDDGSIIEVSREL